MLDLPDAPRPGPDVPAPPRFLPEYDNLLLSHADRTRFITGGEAVPLQPGLGARYGTLLVDGLFRGTWRITRHDERAVLHIEPFERLRERDAIAVAEEGEALVRFAVEGATRLRGPLLGLEVPDAPAYDRVHRVAGRVPESAGSVIVVRDQSRHAPRPEPAQMLLAGVEQPPRDPTPAMVRMYREPVHVAPPAIPPHDQRAHDLPFIALGHQ